MSIPVARDLLISIIRANHHCLTLRRPLARHLLPPRSAATPRPTARATDCVSPPHTTTGSADSLRSLRSLRANYDRCVVPVVSPCCQAIARGSDCACTWHGTCITLDL